MDPSTRMFFVSLKSLLDRSVFTFRIYRFGKDLPYDLEGCPISKAEKSVQDYYDCVCDFLDHGNGDQVKLYAALRILYFGLQTSKDEHFPSLKIPLLEVFEKEDEDEEGEY